jgi:aryl-alcohol dehydrogenase-like predicted oxidoreductase
MAFTLKSTARLPGGHQIPLLGLGVYQNYDARTSVLQALEAGYRHIDSAQAYRNEEAVGQGIAESGVRRDDIFVSKGYSMGFWKKLIATPCPWFFVFFVSEQDHRKESRIPIGAAVRR